MLEYRYQEYDRIENARTLREYFQVSTDEDVYNILSQDMTNFHDYSVTAW